MYSHANGFSVTFSQSHFFSSFTKTEFRIILSFTTNGYGKAVDLLELEFTSSSCWLSVVSIEEELSLGKIEHKD